MSKITIICVTVVILLFILLLVNIIFKLKLLPTKERNALIRSWLLEACLDAEKNLGSKRGQEKLNYVYDLFIVQFPLIRKFITQKQFNALVDNALNLLQLYLTNNELTENLKKGVNTKKQEEELKNV